MQSPVRGLVGGSDDGPLVCGGSGRAASASGFFHLPRGRHRSGTWSLATVPPVAAASVESELFPLWE